MDRSVPVVRAVVFHIGTPLETLHKRNVSLSP
ncbi:hypothetical protein MSKU15_2888 [Komagataeibacter diospyri]|uniref:Uncharacterized protein n=1 Tax=Komagataeibacter diospyri TaxID=1932662 RepID=A0A4P5NXQ4_9PROT|nr:hypothetical protein MSKU9_2586 [Komagataeibacter diospyri]GCE91287.1 hypothetical protein MSKU15_2888 [Komagataeibacter diospyri]